MSYSLNFLLLPHEIRGCRQLRHQLVKGINLTYCLKQQKESPQRDIAGCPILKLVNGCDRNTRLLRHLFLRHVAAQTVVLESGAKKFYQLRYRI